MVTKQSLLPLSTTGTLKCHHTLNYQKKKKKIWELTHKAVSSWTSVGTKQTLVSINLPLPYFVHSISTPSRFHFQCWTMLQIHWLCYHLSAFLVTEKFVSKPLFAASHQSLPMCSRQVSVSQNPKKAFPSFKKNILHNLILTAHLYVNEFSENTCLL